MSETEDHPYELALVPAIDPQFAKARKAAERRAIRKARATKIVRVLNLGAGVQSTTLLLMDAMAHRWGRRDELQNWLGEDYPFAPFDFAVFADTQEEPRAVIEHLARLKAMDTAPILEGTAGRLGDDLIRTISTTPSRFASIPAYTTATEGQPEGITRRQCTREYKIDVVERIIRRDILGLPPGEAANRDTKVVQSFGLSWDEPGRIFKTRERVSSQGWTDPEFILADLIMERVDCKSFLKSIGIEAPRSACVFCPYRSNAEWRDLRDKDPEGWARAVEVDEGMRRAEAACAKGMDNRLYVHRSCLPLARAPIDEPDLPGLGFGAECEGMCGS